MNTNDHQSTDSRTDDRPVVRIRHLQKSFGDLEVLKDVSLDIAVRQVLVIISPSRSGKKIFSNPQHQRAQAFLHEVLK